jgi:membrane dipeptidase
MFTIDAHLDLSMNAMEWNRDLRWSITELRDAEKNLSDRPDRSNGTVSFSELRKGNIMLVVGTLIARVIKPGSDLPGWFSPEQAWAQTQAQLAWYKSMEEAGELKLISNRRDLDEHERLYKDISTDGKAPIGYILSLEGADSIITPAHLERSYHAGLRAIGLSHYGPGRYAFGTDSDGPLSTIGVELLKEVGRLNMILDVTHLSDESFWQALSLFNGTVWASHNNCRSLVPHNRQFSDEMIRALIERDAVIGAALDAWMLVPGWVRGKSTPAKMNCSLETVVDHIDHVCQLAGNADHAGIGSDLDGAFGKEQCPHDLDTIADLSKFPGLLAKRGYSRDDISKIMHGNWLRLMSRGLP